MQCEGTTSRGRRCKIAARPGERYCRTHMVREMTEVTLAMLDSLIAERVAADAKALQRPQNRARVRDLAKNWAGGWLLPDVPAEPARRPRVRKRPSRAKAA